MDRVKLYRSLCANQQVRQLKQIDKDITKVLYCLIFAFIGMITLIGLMISNNSYHSHHSYQHNDSLVVIQTHHNSNNTIPTLPKTSA